MALYRSAVCGGQALEMACEREDGFLGLRGFETETETETVETFRRLY